MPSVILSPSPTRIASIGVANDPYKKYWWGVLSFFGLVGFWICLPMMEPGVGSARVAMPQPTDESLEQPLDAAGVEAPGLPMDEGAYRKKRDDGPVMSSLYQAPPESGAAAAGTPLVDGKTANLAEALKAVGRKKVEIADDGGWGGRKAQRGFSAPRLGGSGLSGLGGGSASGGSAASFSGGSGLFGSRAAQVGFANTRGLRDDGRGVVGGASGQALGGALEASKAALKSGSEEALAGAGAAFDGGAGRKNSVGGPAGGGALAQLRTSLDAAPANLKSDTALGSKKITAAPPTSETPPEDKGQQMAQQLGMMIVGSVIGGMLPGMAGTIFTQMMQQGFQDAKAEAARKRAEENTERARQQAAAQYPSR